MRAAGLDGKIVMLQKNTATAAQAAAVLGCDKAEIAKSLMFRRAGGGAVLAVISGDRRVSAEKLSAAAGEAVAKADARFVLENGGYEIGGVPPVGHPPELPVFMDLGMFQYETMWAAAGSAHAVFPFAPASIAAAGAQKADIAE
ncbi:MAG: YbaK/EbsC family protein [Betaproteobacteria bacterium]|nr:YbaK/EbsC family protein [Betaproteobacteria bacterium]